MSNKFDPDRDPEKLLNGIKASNESNWFSGGTAHILPAERKKATFKHNAMTFIVRVFQSDTHLFDKIDTHSYIHI